MPYHPSVARCRRVHVGAQNTLSHDIEHAADLASRMTFVPAFLLGDACIIILRSTVMSASHKVVDCPFDDTYDQGIFLIGSIARLTMDVD